MFPAYFKLRVLSHERSYKFIILVDFIGKNGNLMELLDPYPYRYIYSKNFMLKYIFLPLSAPISLECCLYQTIQLTDWLRSVLTGVVMMIQWPINGCSYDGEGEWEPAAGVQWITMYCESGREDCRAAINILAIFNLVDVFWASKSLKLMWKNMYCLRLEAPTHILSHTDDPFRLIQK